MFEKEILPPKLLLQAEAVEGRLPENHRSIPGIKMKIKSLRSGYNGEKAMNYYLQQIPNQKYHIFHDLRLPYGNGFFQIDAFLLSEKLNLILEGKNHSGTLHIEKNQMIQVFNGNREVYENPISQANRHKLLLNYFLEQYQIPPIPTEFFVVVSKPSTEVIISPDYSEAYKRIYKVGDLLEIIEATQKKYKRNILSQQTIENIIRILLNSHTPNEYDILEMFAVDPLDILTGVHCPNCLHLPMIFNRMNWICPHCHFVSHDAYLKAINDYFLIYNTTISNAELCRFLHIPSPRTATYIFSLLNFPCTGTRKHRIYHNPNHNLPIMFPRKKPTL